MSAAVDLLGTLHSFAAQHPAVAAAARAVSLLGSPAVCDVVAVAVAVVLLRQASRSAPRWVARPKVAWAAVFVLAAAFGAGALSRLSKAAVHRPRPHLTPVLATAQGFSMPSGHALSVTATYGAVLVLWLATAAGQERRSPRARRSLIAAYAMWALAVGTSRVLLGVHYPSDVAVGILLGLGWVAVCWLALGRRAIGRSLSA